MSTSGQKAPPQSTRHHSSKIKQITLVDSTESNRLIDGTPLCISDSTACERQKRQRKSVSRLGIVLRQRIFRTNQILTAWAKEKWVHARRQIVCTKSPENALKPDNMPGKQVSSGKENIVRSVLLSASLTGLFWNRNLLSLLPNTRHTIGRDNGITALRWTGVSRAHLCCRFAATNQTSSTRGMYNVSISRSWRNSRRTKSTEV